MHGDLTTSNLIIRTSDAALARNHHLRAHAVCGASCQHGDGGHFTESEDQDDAVAAVCCRPHAYDDVGRRLQVVIDFGLSQHSTLAEDKAVDLYVLERAFISAHSADGNGLVRLPAPPPPPSPLQTYTRVPSFAA